MTGTNSNAPKTRRCVVDDCSPAIGMSGQATLVGQRGHGFVDLVNAIAPKPTFASGEIIQGQVKVTKREIGPEGRSEMKLA